MEEVVVVEQLRDGGHALVTRHGGVLVQVVGAIERVGARRGGAHVAGVEAVRAGDVGIRIDVVARRDRGTRRQPRVVGRDRPVLQRDQVGRRERGCEEVRQPRRVRRGRRALRTVVRQVCPTGLGPHAIAERIERHEIVPEQQMAVRGIDHVAVGLVGRHDLDVVGRHERVGQVEQRALHAHVIAGLQPLGQRGRDRRDIEVLVAPFALARQRHGLARAGAAGEVVERRAHGGLGREREHGRAGTRREFAARDVACDRQERQIAVHEHLHFVAEHVDAGHALREAGDDASATGVVQLAQRGLGGVGRLQAIEAADEVQVRARRGLGRGLGGAGRERARAPARRAVGPQERRHVIARVEVRDGA